MDSDGSADLVFVYMKVSACMSGVEWLDQLLPSRRSETAAGSDVLMLQAAGLLAHA